MKLRNGFVSNSSSSSFVCDVCGETATGWDICLSEANMYQCENEHTFCESEALSPVEFKKDEDFERSYIPMKYCPICNFIEVSNSDIGRYFEKTSGITREDVFAEIKKVNKRRKKLRDNEYVETVCIKKGIDPQKLLAELKEKHKDYKSFLKSLR